MQQYVLTLPCLRHWRQVYQMLCLHYPIHLCHYFQGTMDLRSKVPHCFQYSQSSAIDSICATWIKLLRVYYITLVWIKLCLLQLTLVPLDKYWTTFFILYGSINFHVICKPSTHTSYILIRVSYMCITNNKGSSTSYRLAIRKKTTIDNPLLPFPKLILDPIYHYVLDSSYLNFLDLSTM